MSKTGISFQMTTEHFDRIVENITNLDLELGFAVGFSKEQRGDYQKMGDKTVAFINKTMEYTTDRPELVPPYSPITEFQLDYDLANKLRLIIEKLEPVFNKITDSYLSVGDDVFSMARKFYGFIKAASLAGAPGTTPIVLELGKRYARTKHKEKAVLPPEAEIV